MIYNLRKLTHGLTIPPVCSSLMCRNFLIRMLYTDVYLHLPVYIAAYRFFYLQTFLYVCVFVTVTALRIVDVGNKEANLLT